MAIPAGVGNKLDGLLCAPLNMDTRLIQFGLQDGGTAGSIYGFMIGFAGFSCVYLSVSEMASMLVFEAHTHLSVF